MLQRACNIHVKLLECERHRQRSLRILFHAEDASPPILKAAVYELARGIEFIAAHFADVGLAPVTVCPRSIQKKPDFIEFCFRHFETVWPRIG